MRLNLHATNIFGTCIQKLTPPHNKCNSGGDYVENKLKYVRIFVYNYFASSSSFFFFVKCSPDSE
jgi:hypothetical protein